MFLALCITLALAPQLAASVRNASNHSCPIWTTPKIESNGSLICDCGDSINEVVSCNRHLDVSIAALHCMSYSEEFNQTVVGHCLYHMYDSYYWHTYYWPVSRQIDPRNNTALCHYTEHCVKHHGITECTNYQHQTGLMCTSCVDGYAYPIYSYSAACVECKDYKYNWLKYIAVAFLPLTVFYIIVVLFRITAISGAMNGYILTCQLLTIPRNSRFLSRANSRVNTGLYFALLGIWNLDFFRGLYTPFCLHPRLSTLQTLMFDYAIAVYPLLLIIATYFCVKLHNHFSVIVWLWSPFYKCFASVRNEWDINRSLVGVFATFFLLSYVKILNVSFYALTPNTLYDVGGIAMPKRFLYYDGTYEYFGARHIPYALLALFMLLVFNITPLVLLCLYPCRCFQKCMNCCGLRALALHVFMDTFHGCYKLQPLDCRHFAALYLFLRILNHILLVFTVENVYLLFAGPMFAIMILLIATIRPHKSPWHALADTVFLTTLNVASLCISGYESISVVDKSYAKLVKYVFLVPLASFPQLYGIGILVYLVIPKKILHKLETLLLESYKQITRKQAETEDPLPYRFDHSEEYTPLLRTSI